MDAAVLSAQVWVNATYGGHPGYEKIEENGKTGWSTVYALTRGLQIELGISSPVDNFGATTESLLNKLGPISTTSNTKSNIVTIIQCGLYCKGYGPGGLTGTYGDGTKQAISNMQKDMGLLGSDVNGVVTAKIFKALLTMDPYVLISGGSSKVRSVQQWLNRKYNHRKNFYFMPCDGNYSRNTQKALIYAIQYEEGLSDDIANGSFGPTTQSKLPNIKVGESDAATSFVHLFQAAMIFNKYDVPFDGVFSSEVSSQLKNFQSFAALPQTGVGDFQSWASLLVSTGDPTRKGKACDCVTMITPLKAQALKNAGYETVGRYLSNVPGSTLNKKIQPGELNNIISAGLTVFPIYQTNGASASYFNTDQGRIDGQAAFDLAREYGFEKGTTIYFAVDFDALGYHITDNIIPHFEGIQERMLNLGGIYKIGIYGPRAVCSGVSEKGLANTSFVSGMSTGFSGNLGYPLPTNWAFDQISTISVGSGDSKIEIDNNIKSGKDLGSKSVNPGVEIPYDPTNTNSLFFNQLDKVYEIALEYANNDISKANKLVAQYYRAVRFSGPLWVVTAGPLDTNFIDTVNEKLNNPVMKELYDPKFKVPLDVPHLAASLNSTIVIWGTNGFIADLAGWAGDLLTTAGDSVNAREQYSSIYEAALDFIGNKEKGQFGLADLIADVDALNIGYILGNSTKQLNTVMKEYYSQGYKKRFTSFLNNRFSIPNMEKSKYLEEQATAILISDEIGIHETRALFIEAFNIPYYTDEEGKEVARAFTDIIMKNVNNEKS